jgi:hypothetical protein
MALAIDIDIGDSGFVASYFRVGHVALDFSATQPSETGEGEPDGVVTVRMWGYATQAARISGKGRVYEATVDFPYAALAADMAGGGVSDLRELLYAAIKTTPTFAAAQDV